MKIIRIILFTIVFLLLIFIANMFLERGSIGELKIDNNFREKKLLTFANQVLKPDFRHSKIDGFGKRIKSTENYEKFIAKVSIDNKESTYGYVEDKKGKVLSKYIAIEVDSYPNRNIKTIVMELNKYFDMPKINQEEWSIEKTINSITYRYKYPNIEEDMVNVRFAKTMSYTTGYTIIFGACEISVSFVKQEGFCF